MTRQSIIEHTINIINQLPNDKASEISDFADFLLKKYENQILTANIQQLVSEGDSFHFLNEDENLYSESDLKEKFND